MIIKREGFDFFDSFFGIKGKKSRCEPNLQPFCAKEPSYRGQSFANQFYDPEKNIKVKKQPREWLDSIHLQDFMARTPLGPFQAPRVLYPSYLGFWML